MMLSRSALVLIVIFSLAFVAMPSTQAVAQDCNANGVLDSLDIDPSDPDGNGDISADCNANGIPDECDLVGPRLLGATRDSSGATRDSSLVTIDLATGQHTVVATLGCIPNALAFDAVNNVIYTTCSDVLFEVDATTYQVSTIGHFGITNIFGMPGMAFDAITDTLFAANPDSVFEIDRSTGAATEIEQISACCIGGMTFDPRSRTLIVIDNDPCGFIIVDPSGVNPTQRLTHEYCYSGMTYDSKVARLLGAAARFDGSDITDIVEFEPVALGVPTIIGEVGQTLGGLVYIPGSYDVNQDGIPDECQSGVPDCNQNGMLDSDEPAYIDIILFANLLLDESGSFSDGCLFDVNTDGQINGLDLEGFIARLLG